MLFYPDKSTINHKVSPKVSVIAGLNTEGFTKSIRVDNATDGVVKLGFDSPPHVRLYAGAVETFAMPPDVKDLNLSGEEVGVVYITPGRMI